MLWHSPFRLARAHLERSALPPNAPRENRLPPVGSMLCSDEHSLASWSEGIIVPAALPQTIQNDGNWQESIIDNFLSGVQIIHGGEAMRPCLLFQLLVVNSLFGGEFWLDRGASA